MQGLWKPRLWQAVLQLPIRSFSSASHQNVNKSLLSKLRKQTGIPFINCKKALAKFDNDFDQAKTWLLEEAQKEGWARATKLQSRAMSQGLVAVMGNDKQAVMLEVNCETDFVARNEKFISMVTKLVHECNSHFEKFSEKKVVLNKAQLGEISSSENVSLADIVALNVGNLGENLALRRGAFMRAEDNSVLSFYVHPAGKKPKTVLLGKYGAVVNMEQTNPPHDNAVMSLGELGSDLCPHIVGMNPKTIGEYVPGSEKEVGTKGVEQSGEGVGAALSDDEEPTPAPEVFQEELLKQEFLLDTSMSVGELTYLNAVRVVDFLRFACGEELEDDKDG